MFCVSLLMAASRFSRCCVSPAVNWSLWMPCAIRCCWRLRRVPGEACAGAGCVDVVVVLVAAGVPVAAGAGVLLDCALAVSANTNPAAVTVKILIPFKFNMAAPLSFSPESGPPRAVPGFSPPAIRFGDRTTRRTQAQSESFGAVTIESAGRVGCKSLKKYELARDLHSTCPCVPGDSVRHASWKSPRLPVWRMRGPARNATGRTVSTLRPVRGPQRSERAASLRRLSLHRSKRLEVLGSFPRDHRCLPLHFHANLLH